MGGGSTVFPQSSPQPVPASLPLHPPPPAHSLYWGLGRRQAWAWSLPLPLIPWAAFEPHSPRLPRGERNRKHRQSTQICPRHSLGKAVRRRVGWKQRPWPPWRVSWWVSAPGQLSFRLLGFYWPSKANGVCMMEWSLHYAELSFLLIPRDCA